MEHGALPTARCGMRRTASRRREILRCWAPIRPRNIAGNLHRDEDNHTRWRVPRARPRGRGSGKDGVHRWCPPSRAIPSTADLTFALLCSTMAATTWHRCRSMRQWTRAKDRPVKSPKTAAKSHGATESRSWGAQAAER
jgi:hypothetical protein